MHCVLAKSAEQQAQGMVLKVRETLVGPINIPLRRSYAGLARNGISRIEGEAGGLSNGERLLGWNELRKARTLRSGS